MKKLLLLSLLTVATTLVYGQENLKKWRGINVGAGLNFTNSYGESPFSSESVNTYNFEVTTGYNFTDILSVDAGLQFYQIGTPDYLEERSNFVAIPIDFNARIYKGLHGAVGTYFAFSLDENNYARYLGGVIVHKLNKFDSGLRFKLFYELCRFRVSAAYSLGLSNSSDIDEDRAAGNSYEKFDTSNNMFNIGVSFKIIK